MHSCCDHIKESPDKWMGDKEKCNCASAHTSYNMKLRKIVSISFYQKYNMSICGLLLIDQNCCRENVGIAVS